MYKLLRARIGKNPNPIVITNRRAVSTSKQIQDYLLCGACEQMFSRNGESWVMGNCYRGTQDFALREALERAIPAISTTEYAVYESAKILGADRCHLSYFAASVFWRAAVHCWKISPFREFVHINLGPYEESLRRFLLGEQDFPPKMVMAIRVSSLRTLLETASPPGEHREYSIFSFQFSIPGIAFALMAGGRIPASYYDWCFVPSPGALILVKPDLDLHDLRLAAVALANGKKRGQ